MNLENLHRNELSYEKIINNFNLYKNHADLNLWLSQAEGAEALAVKKLLKKAEIDLKRDEALEKDVEFKNKTYQAGLKDRNLLTSTVSLFSINQAVPEGFKWISKDNEAVDFTLQDLVGLGAVMANRVNAVTMKARELKDKAEKAKTAAAVDKIVVEF